MFLYMYLGQAYSWQTRSRNSFSAATRTYDSPALWTISHASVATSLST